MKNKITQHTLRSLFIYHKDGYLIRKSNNRIAGHKNKDGYVHVHIYGKYYKLHRLIFLYHHGYMPENIVDHTDRDISNNRIENLKEVSSRCNNRNIGIKSNNKSGVTGVCFAKHINK